MPKTINVPRASESLGNMVSKLNQTYKEKEMKLFNHGDRVQVFDLKRFNYLGWGIVKEVYTLLPRDMKCKSKKAVLVKLDSGAEIYADGEKNIALSKDEAIEVANRILEDVEKAGD